MSEAALHAEALSKRYRRATALEGVSLWLPRGCYVAVVGESGSGKSTLARCLAGLEKPDSGLVRFKGTPLNTMRGKLRRSFHLRVQLVLQDAAMALNPRWPGLELVREPLDLLRNDLARPERDRIARDWMERLGLPDELRQRMPDEMSGGQRQRLLLARAMTLQPEWLLLDEPLTGLDAPVQAEFLAILRTLRAERELGCLLVTHDLAVALAEAGHVAVMQHGHIVEQANPSDLMLAPREPYTQRLLACARACWERFSAVPYINRSGRPPL